jgi:hypothetical protein
MKGGNLIFKINNTNKIIRNKEENDIILTTNKDRVFHQAKNPTTQNIKGETKP